MSEQLYRVCWRNYWNASEREPEIEIGDEALTMPIGEATQFIEVCRTDIDPLGCADYWLQPI